MGIAVNEDEHFKEEADSGRGGEDFNGREEEGPNTLQQHHLMRDEDSQLQQRHKGQPQNPPTKKTQPTPAQGDFVLFCVSIVP